MDLIQIVSVEECLLYLSSRSFMFHINRQREFYRRVHVNINGLRLYVSVSHVGTYGLLCAADVRMIMRCDLLV